MNAPFRPRPYIETVPDHVIADGWRHALLVVDDQLSFIRQDLATIAGRDKLLPCSVRVHSARYVEQCARYLPWRYSLYLAAVKNVSESEAEMDRRGMRYSREAV